MKDTQSNPQTDWPVIFDELKRKESLSSDARLAASLGVTRAYVCSVRKGRKGVSLELARAIFSRLGRTFDTERLEKLFVPAKVLTYTANLRTFRDYVIARANGHCQLCGIQAPFNSPDGKPYLEVHYVIPLEDCGENSTNNLVALCPNCHRKIEISPMDSDVKKLKLLTKRYQKRETVSI